MKLHFFGAAGTVTGSKHVIESEDYKLLLDCGLHQGHRQEAYELNKALPFSAAEIDATILSHAHADHCGTLPLLAHEGYKKAIHCTPATAAIAHLIMTDSARVQEGDYRHLLENNPNGTFLPPLYTFDDVEAAAALFSPVEYFRRSKAWTTLNDRIRFKLYDAGHILGSAVSLIEVKEAGETKNILFTGDLGNSNVPILPDPEAVSEAVDALIIECTYGDRNHEPVSNAEDLLEEVITDAVKNKRRIIVPAFALGRTQELIYILHKLHKAGRIPVIPIYIDSPLSNGITEVFAKYKDDFDSEAWQDFIKDNESPFAFDKLTYIATAEESKQLNFQSGPFMVIASSGMAEGGRVLHHLIHCVRDPEAVVILTGYQAESTLGRRLQDGVTPVRIHDRWYDVRARVLTISQFSAHADQNGLVAYISSLKGLKQVFLVHGEAHQAAALEKILQEKIPSLLVHIPQPGDSFAM